MTDPNDLPPLTELPPGTVEVGRWLDVATRDLCDDAKVRVRAEVEAHFRAAFDAAFGEGSSVAAAGALAVEALGNPKRARKRFRKMYFTNEELGFAKAINEEAGTLMKIFTAVTALVFAAMVVVTVAGATTPQDYLGLSYLMTPLVLYLSLCKWFLPASVRRRHPRLYLLTSAIAAIVAVSASMAAWSIMAYGRHSGAAVFDSKMETYSPYLRLIALVCAGLLMAVVMVKHFIFIGKLRHKHNRDPAGL